MQNKMEAFLSQLYSDLLQRQEDVQRLESILRAKDEEHNQQVQQLFEEMEAQLSEDKEAIVQQVRSRSSCEIFILLGDTNYSKLNLLTDITSKIYIIVYTINNPLFNSNK